MDTIGDRIKQIRKEFLLTQDEFGSRVKVTNAHISKIENNNDCPSDMLIKLITIEFNINEEWLRDGVGEKHKKPPKGARDALNDNIILKQTSDAYIEKYIKIIKALGPSGTNELYIPFLEDPDLLDIINYLQHCFINAKTQKEKIEIMVRFDITFPGYRDIVAKLNDDYKINLENIKKLKVAEGKTEYNTD